MWQYYAFLNETGYAAEMSFDHDIVTGQKLIKAEAMCEDFRRVYSPE